MLRLPSTLKEYSGGKSQILLAATTLADLLTELSTHYPAIWSYLCTSDGHIRNHVRIFVNNALVTSEDDMDIELVPDHEVIILPATN